MYIVLSLFNIIRLNPMGKAYNLKITLLGDGAVGKTSLKNRFMGRGFRREHLMTIGADFAVYEKQYGEDKITFQIWDLAGQDTFKSVRARFFRGAMGGLCVFDVTRSESFMNVTRWIEELWRNGGRGVVPIILLGNKADLRDDNCVSPKQADAFAEALTKKTQQYGFDVHSLDTSAKTGYNVDQAFDTIAKQIIESLEKGTMKLQY